MGRRGLLSALAGAALLAAGCGGGDDSSVPMFTGSDEEQVAGTVNAMTAAIAAGDGETACALMTGHGQQVMLRIGRQAAGQDVGDCPAAVPAAGSAGYDPGDFRIRPADVSAGAEGAEADCDLEGAFILVRTDEGWRVDVPFCSN